MLADRTTGELSSFGALLSVKLLMSAVDTSLLFHCGVENFDAEGTVADTCSAAGLLY